MEPGAEEKNEGATYDVTQASNPVNKGSVWARLITKVYEVDPFLCTKYSGDMKVVAVIIVPINLIA